MTPNTNQSQYYTTKSKFLQLENCFTLCIHVPTCLYPGEYSLATKQYWLTTIDTQTESPLSS